MRQAWCGLVVLLAMGGGVARARGAEHVEMLGSTVPGTAQHVDGDLDTAVPGTLVFHAPGKNEVRMPYDGVFEFGVSHQEGFHLGFFPAMFYGMVAARPQRYIFTVTWHDASGTAQEATFVVSKSLSEHLRPVMYARARQACERKEFGACAPVVPPPPPPRVPLTEPSPAPAAGNPAHP